MLRVERVRIGDREIAAVGTRDLHADLRLRSRPSEWLRRATEAFGLVEGRDYAVRESRTGGRSRNDAWLTLEVARRVAAAEPSETSEGVLRRLDRGDDARTEVGSDPGPLPTVAPRIVGDREEQAVLGSELHASLRIGTRYVDWMRRRVLSLRLVEGIDYAWVPSTVRPAGVKLKDELNLGGRPAGEHVLTLDAAKHVAMAEHNDVGHAVRTYFIACERRLREMARTEAERLREEVERLSAKPGRPADDEGRPAGGGRADDVGEGTHGAALDDAEAAVVGELLAWSATLRRRRDATLDAAATTGERPTPRAAEADGVTPGPAGWVADATTTTTAPGGEVGYLHRTKCGVVIDLRLRVSGSRGADREAAVAHAGCPPVTARAFRFWQEAHGSDCDPSTEPTQRGLGTTYGITLGMRRLAVATYEEVRAERVAATADYAKAKREAFWREANAAAWARHRGELN